MSPTDSQPRLNDLKPVTAPSSGARLGAASGPSLIRRATDALLFSRIFAWLFVETLVAVSSKSSSRKQHC